MEHRLRPSGAVRPRRGGGAAARSTPAAAMLAHSSSRLVPRVDAAGRHGHARRLRGARRDRLADQPQRDRGRALARARCAARSATPAPRSPAPASTRRASSATRRTSSTSATARSASRCAGCCGARRPARCTSTSACPTPRPRSAPSTACARTCRCCRRSPRTRPTGTGSTPASQTARAQLFRGYPRADIPRAFAGWEDYATVDGRASSPPPASRTTRSCGGTCARTRSSARSRCGRWTPRRASARSCGLAALVHGLALAAAHEPARGRAARRARCSSSPPSAPGATGSTRRVWHDGALRPVRERIAAALELARPYARDAGAEARSRRSSGSCARATAPTACAPPTPRAACRASCTRLITESAEPLGAPASAA